MDSAHRSPCHPLTSKCLCHKSAHRVQRNLPAADFECSAFEDVGYKGARYGAVRIPNHMSGHYAYMSTNTLTNIITILTVKIRRDWANKRFEID